VRQVELLYADETAWKEHGRLLWLWVFTCATGTLSIVGRRTRGPPAAAVPRRRWPERSECYTAVQTCFRTLRTLPAIGRALIACPGRPGRALRADARRSPVQMPVQRIGA